ncbi:MAG: ABC transporter ATP-binding protein [Actinobacteria bacterium]|nr:MAG: ABC transporter ATP-binding protein [Actinomycetota bacterium]
MRRHGGRGCRRHRRGAAAGPRRAGARRGRGDPRSCRHGRGRRRRGERRPPRSGGRRGQPDARAHGSACGVPRAGAARPGDRRPAAGVGGASGGRPPPVGDLGRRQRRRGAAHRPRRRRRLGAHQGAGDGGPRRSPGAGVTPVLRTDALGKDYDETVALEDLSVSVGEGERVIVVGPNGSGKTTLLRITAGLLEPTSGRVVVAGAPPGSLPARAATSYVPDAPVLYDDLSVLEHLEYVGRLHGNEAWEDSAGELVERLGLEERVDDLPARFSRGLRQKTSIALGLVRPFSLLLVDEPFVGLDAGGRLALLELLDESAAAGAAVVVATHQLEFVDQASRCLGLRDGRLVYDGPATPGRVERLVS